MQFAYEARTEDGGLSTGVITAETLDQAGRMLSERDLYVVRIAADRRRHRVEVKGGATRAEVAWTMSQLAIMVTSGIHLSEALHCLARQATRPALKAMMEQISKTVEEGRALSEAMELYPKAFPTSLTAWIRASEVSGTLSIVLQRSAAYLSRDLQIIRRMRAATRYPLFMLATCLAVTVFLLTVILPRFADVFATRGALLPAPTRLLMGLSSSLISDWYWWAGGAAVAFFSALTWMRSAIGRRQLDYLALTLPVLSNVCSALYLSRAFRAMAIMIDTGVPLLDAVGIVREIVPNRYHQALWMEIDEQIQNGERLAGPLLKTRLVPESIAQMIDAGDRSGRLSSVFAQLADFIEEEHDRAVKSALTFIEPCMILAMGGVIGFIAAALMLPLFQAGRIIAG